MSNQTLTQVSNPWDVLEQPRGSMQVAYRILLAAMDTGWQVEEPVYLRPRWTTEGELVFHFILKQRLNRQSRMITVRQSQEVERLIVQEGWKVDRYHI